MTCGYGDLDGSNVITGKDNEGVESSRVQGKLKKNGYEGIYMANNEYAMGKLKELDKMTLVSIIKEELKLEVTEGEHLKQESLKKEFQEIFVCVLDILMLHLHGGLLRVHLLFLPLNLNRSARVTHSSLHLEDKVKV